MQIYRTDSHLFLPDGPHPAVDARQSLAARGMAVLQVWIPAEEGKGVQNISRRVVEDIDGAVSALSSEGLVDPARVALTGFSNGGFRVLCAIANVGQTNFAAAIAADFFTGTYSAYLQYAAHLDDLGGTDQAFQDSRGGDFWTHRSEWLAHEPTFNADRIATPLMITLHGAGTRAHDEPEILNVIGALRRTHKPFEYVYLRDAEHNLMRPRERLAMMTAAVDWLAFWLKGEVPGDPQLANHWLRLRARQEGVIAEMAARGVPLAPLPAVH